MKFSKKLFLLSMSLMMFSMLLLFNNMFISMEIPLTNLLSFYINISMMMDWISILFLATVLFISSMIISFSMFYIPMKEHKKFCMMLLMFVSSMSILIISDNIIFILLGWDGLGLSSYVLVIYYQNFSSAASGSITLLSNRIGDIMILITISIMLMNSNWNFNMNKEFNLLMIILLLTAAFSKSAQFPFSAWLPAAMAAPTPISALVHSSTLVTAGVFLLIRILNKIHPISLMILMISSSLTAMYAGLAANWEQDLKKIIALSTLSQIAMMMFAISMKSTILAFFHLIIHALFKSSMFLCAGIMIHNSSYQDMRMMGLNYLYSPLTPTIMGISSLALMGMPFMSGFFSKDLIIENLLNLDLNSVMSTLMIISIGLTASYSLRMSILSNNHLIKSKPDSESHNSKFSNLPISIMSPTSITLGAILLWILNSEQMFLLPFIIKIMIPLMLMIGMTLGLTMSFKSKNFNKMGESSLSLWFIHFMSTYMMNFTSSSMNLFIKNDKSWQESYGPQGMFISMKNQSSLPDFAKSTMLFTMIMLMLIPFIIM